MVDICLDKYAKYVHIYTGEAKLWLCWGEKLSTAALRSAKAELFTLVGFPADTGEEIAWTLIHSYGTQSSFESKEVTQNMFLR